MYRPDEKKLVRLADEEVADVAITGRGRWASARATTAYELQGNLDGQRFQDVYAVDTKTGQKKVVKKELRWGNAASPDGSKYLYYENQHFHVYDMEIGHRRATSRWACRRRSSTSKTTTTSSIRRRPSSAGRADNAHVLISDRWDIWKIPVAGGAGGEPDGERQQGSDSLPDANPDRSGGARHRPRPSRSTSRRWPSGRSAPATACSSRVRPG